MSVPYHLLSADSKYGNLSFAAIATDGKSEEMFARWNIDTK